MNDFTRDILETTTEILHLRGILDDESADSFVADIEEDAEAVVLFEVFAEQARLVGFEQGYDEGYDDASEVDEEFVFEDGEDE